MTTKKKILALLACLIVVPSALAWALEPPRYAVATTPTPVLNTPEFRKFFSGKLQLDPCQGVRPVEFVALTGTLFRIQGEQVKDGVTVYRVTSNDYPYRGKTGYFVDARFVKVVSSPVERKRTLPAIPAVQQRLLAAVDKPYVWGGNVKDGVPLLRELYPKGDPLAGVDCSGLLYEATDGYTWRNTSALVRYGAPVPVAGLSAEQIARVVEPLDLVVWNGHVMIVLDQDSIIQSTMGCDGGPKGVHVTPLRETLQRLMKRRHPADRFPDGPAGAKAFVVRRWYPR